LLNDSGVTGIVGSRVYTGIPQNPAFEYIRLDIPLSDNPSHGLGFNEPASNVVRFQVNSYATTWTDAATLQDAVFECLEGATVSISNWGEPRIEGEGSTILNEEVEGIKVFNGMSRFRALLTADLVS
jgi:hypothetical protein